MSPKRDLPINESRAAPVNYLRRDPASQCALARPPPAALPFAQPRKTGSFGATKNPVRNAVPDGASGWGTDMAADGAKIDRTIGLARNNPGLGDLWNCAGPPRHQLLVPRRPQLCPGLG